MTNAKSIKWMNAQVGWIHEQMDDLMVQWLDNRYFSGLFIVSIEYLKHFEIIKTA